MTDPGALSGGHGAGGVRPARPAVAAGRTGGRYGRDSNQRTPQGISWGYVVGIESDQLVFDYLSRVGDLAQQRGLPAATRMRLVAGLRSEIDARKADTVPGVKRVLARLGTPEAVVTAAAGGETPRPAAPKSGLGGPAGKVPAPRDGAARPGLLRKPARPAAPEPEPAAAPPHLAGADELGEADDPPDWWRVEPSPYEAEETVPGFVGGIELPEVWKRPAPSTEKDDAEEAPAAGTGGARTRAGVLRGVLGRRRGADPAAADDESAAADEAEPAAASASPWAWLSPVPALAVVLLLAGAVLDQWLALAAGWALAYVSRRLTRAEAKCAALGVPGTAVGGFMVWLWGRFDGRWGDPIAQGRLGQALMDGLPGVARGAAVASAVFVLWRLRRRGR
ncbi:hypothetical protein T261_3378 [Streptomyces lydicus]|nr:hypothetical protein T261_3378 [Streptomyces lydicus]